MCVVSERVPSSVPQTRRKLREQEMFTSFFSKLPKNGTQNNVGVCAHAHTLTYAHTHTHTHTCAVRLFL